MASTRRIAIARSNTRWGLTRRRHLCSVPSPGSMRPHRHHDHREHRDHCGVGGHLRSVRAASTLRQWGTIARNRASFDQKQTEKSVTELRAKQHRARGADSRPLASPPQPRRRQSLRPWPEFAPAVAANEPRAQWAWPSAPTGSGIVANLRCPWRRPAPHALSRGMAFPQCASTQPCGFVPTVRHGHADAGKVAGALCRSRTVSVRGGGLRASGAHAVDIGDVVGGERALGWAPDTPGRSSRRTLRRHRTVSGSPRLPSQSVPTAIDPAPPRIPPDKAGTNTSSPRRS